ncbi:MAG: DUF1285 domain-containing protein [Alphaproteobacteria bacterium]
MPNERPDARDLEAALRSAGPARGDRSSDLVCGDIDIRIARDGTWFYHGSPIGRKRLVKLFSTVLRREADGQFYLVTPVEKGRIQVDDAPFVAVELISSGQGRERCLRMRTNLDEEITVDDEHPIQVVHDPVTGEPSPYVRIRDSLDALIARPVYYELAEIAEEAPGKPGDYGVWSEGAFFVIGRESADA